MYIYHLKYIDSHICMIINNLLKVTIRIMMVD